MQFNSETNGLDLYSDARFQCGIDETSDTTSYAIKAFTRNANFALDRIESLIMKADGWKFDDTNQTGELIDTSQTFTASTKKISVQGTWRTISRVRIPDANGNMFTLPEIIRRQLSDGQLNNPAGTPIGYYRLGNYLYFDKAVSYAGTIEVQFQRGSSYFVYTDTTKTPGFDANFHRLISLHAAVDWCDLYSPQRSPALRSRIGSPPDLMNNEAGSGMEKELVDFYSRRDGDASVTLIPRRDDYGQIGLSNAPTGSPNGRSPYGFL